ncbi:hypothetical protein MN0502_23870 [Arthrobacter sp. MN05-02]|nr:hypothetical protein MN0502_23870 [Arthrobacter sp. MN05-02]
MSRGQRAAGAAALIAVLGLTGWGVAAGSLAPAPEPTTRSAQVDGPSSAPSGASGSASAEPEPDPSALTLPGSTPAPTPAGPEVSATDVPAAPGLGSDAFAPPTATGKIIDQPPPVAAPQPFEEPADVAEGVAARVAAMKAVDGEARGIGEVDGPAVQFTVEITNSTEESISLAEAVVNVEAGTDRFPAGQLSGPGATPFPADVAPGQTVSGVFVFQIPPEQREAVRVLFHYQAVSPVAAFEGSVPLQGEAP